MAFMIRCSVSGGVTGFRTSRLKQDGVEARFDSRDEAERVAASCRRSVARNATARFVYEVIEVDDVELEVEVGDDEEDL